MGWFTREEKMDMETGKFETKKKGLFRRDSNTPVSDKLLAQDRNDKRDKRVARRREYREAFEESRHKSKLARMEREGTRAGSLSMSDRFNNVASGFSTQHTVRNNYNPFGSMFDTGMKKPSKSSKKSSTKYKVIGGKAYPIAGTKKKKSKKKSSSSFGGYNMTDNWGFMK